MSSRQYSGDLVNDKPSDLMAEVIILSITIGEEKVVENSSNKKVMRETTTTNSYYSCIRGKLRFFFLCFKPS